MEDNLQMIRAEVIKLEKCIKKFDNIDIDKLKTDKEYRTKIHTPIIEKLQKINEYFLINYKLNFEYEGKVINIIPIETEIYFSKINKDNRPNDGMCHMNDLQKGKDKNGNYRFGKLYFHRWKSSNNIQCASNKTNKGGADVCISNSNDYYLSILIRSAFINGTTEKYLVSGTRRICNRIKEICFDETQGCLQSFFEKLENFSTIVKVERNEEINIDNIFAQPRIVRNKYHEGTKIYKLNCLNLGKNYQYLEWIKKQQFYTVERKKEIMILNDFSKGLNLLDDYDHQQLDKKGNSTRKAIKIKTQDFLKIVDKMKGDFASDVFAVPKDKSFESSVNQVYQTFDDKELYPTLEEKAAMLLYMVVKNHSFVDGNKRIAASCFLYFLDRNKMLYDKTNKPIIDSATLFALTLLIAESNPKDKDIIMQVVISVLNRQ